MMGALYLRDTSGRGIPEPAPAVGIRRVLHTIAAILNPLYYMAVLMGLACKNAILIVEFAREREMEGDTPLQAAIEACRLRLRPIVMTSVAFIAGVLPMVFASGAGAEVRHVMGITVFSGMIGVTFFGLFLTPVFYTALRTLVLKLRQRGV